MYEESIARYDESIARCVEMYHYESIARVAEEYLCIITRASPGSTTQLRGDC